MTLELDDEEINEFGDGLLGNLVQEEDQPPKPSASRGKGPLRKARGSSTRRDEDEADARPSSQQHLFQNINKFKEQQRRDRQSRSPTHQLSRAHPPKQHPSPSPEDMRTRAERALQREKIMEQQQKQQQLEREAKLQAQKQQGDSDDDDDSTVVDETLLGQDATASTASKPSAHADTTSESAFTEEEASTHTSRPSGQNEDETPPKEVLVGRKSDEGTPNSTSNAASTATHSTSNAASTATQVPKIPRKDSTGQPKDAPAPSNAAKTAAKATNKPSKAPTAKKTFPQEIVDYKKSLIQDNQRLLDQVKRGNAASRLTAATKFLEEGTKYKVECAYLHLQLKQIKADPASVEKVNKACVTLAKANKEKDKTIAQLEAHIKDLEARSKATAGKVNNSIAEKVTCWAKEEGWRTTKFLPTDDDTRILARKCIKKLDCCAAFRGGKEQEESFFLTYKKALQRGINARRNYLVQELKKVAWKILENGKPLPTADELVKCAMRDIDVQVCASFFCPHA